MILFASDIHGRITRAKTLANIINVKKPDHVILLGDYLYNGPRNGVPEDYDPLGVSEVLNSFADKVIGVRGNCDSRIDNDLLKFPLEDNRRVTLEGHTFDLFHGDAFSLKMLAPQDGDILVSGHTHLYVLRKEGQHILLNPGSISFPKGGNPATYAVLEGDLLSILNFEEGTPVLSLRINS
jgi:putative phosphoesterase